MSSIRNNHPLERWRSYAGVSWEAPVDGADPAPFGNSVNSPICGVHFDALGTVFVSTPRLLSVRSPAANFGVFGTRFRLKAARGFG